MVRRIFGAVLKIVLILILAISVTTLFLYFSSRNLTVTFVSKQLDVKRPIRIIHLSDLHNEEFGVGNSELIQLIKDQKPDLIFMSGDMLTRDDSDTEIIINLIQNINDTATIYFGYGNHEVSWEEKWNHSLISDIEAAGAVVVNNNYYDVVVNGTDLRIGGYMGYYRQPQMLTEDQSVIQIEKEFAENFENTGKIKLLINHIPTAWLDWRYIDKYPVDVVFSGHYHGGVVRIPLINQGVFAPYIGWFPPYTKGVYTGELATCILSAGLGDERNIPRINNPPEIVVVDLVPEE